MRGSSKLSSGSSKLSSGSRQLSNARALLCVSTLKGRVKVKLFDVHALCRFDVRKASFS